MSKRMPLFKRDVHIPWRLIGVVGTYAMLVITFLGALYYWQAHVWEGRLPETNLAVRVWYLDDDGSPHADLKSVADDAARGDVEAARDLLLVCAEADAGLIYEVGDETLRAMVSSPATFTKASQTLTPQQRQHAIHCLQRYSEPGIANISFDASVLEAKNGGL